MIIPERMVLDVAGGTAGGAGKWKQELESFVRSWEPPVTVIGRERRLTSRWLLSREVHARGAGATVAANNASFAFAGGHRRVLVHNALHFAAPDEAHLVRTMPRSFHAQIPVVRRLLGRADMIVVPSSAMAERVRQRVPAVRDRIVVRLQPLTPIAARLPSERPFILVPVLPGPYKSLTSQLEMLLAAVEYTGRSIEVRVTSRRTDLPASLVYHPALRLLGYLTHSKLAEHWCRATAAFFPSTLESFGYPLAQARAYGLPVISPDTELAREVAGPALLPYDPRRPKSLAGALERIGTHVVPGPQPFDPDSYFCWLLDLPTGRPAARIEETDVHRA